MDELRRRHVFRAAAWYAGAAAATTQVLDLVAGRFGLPPEFMRGVIVLGLSGLPLTCIVAWFYELSPESIATPAAAGDTDAVPSALWRAASLWFALAAGVVFGAVVVRTWQALVVTAPTGVSGLAVLPLANLGGDASDQAFVAGLHDSLLGELATNPRFRVLPRGAVSDLGTRLDLASLGERFDVRYAMEGTVLRDGPRLRLDVRLFDVDSGRLAWRASYQRTLGDVFLVQRELAESVARTLTVGDAGARPVASSADPDAVLLYLQTLGKFPERDVWDEAVYDGPDYDDAVAALERAVEIDPGFAAAWGLLARAHAIRAQAYFFNRPAYPQHIARAREALGRAQALDSNQHDAALARYWIAMADGDFADAEAAAKRAISLRPNDPEGIHLLAHVTEDLGRWSDALGYFELRATLQPDVADSWLDIGQLQLALGQYPAADQAFKRAGRIDGMRAVFGLLASRVCATGDDIRMAFHLRRSNGEAQVALGHLSHGDIPAALRDAERAYHAFEATRTKDDYFSMEVYEYAEVLNYAGRHAEAGTVFGPFYEATRASSIADMHPRRRPLVPLIESEYLRFVGRRQDAYDALERAGALLRPDDVSSLAVHFRRLIGMKYASMGDADRALKWLTPALKTPTIDPVNGCPWVMWRDYHSLPLRSDPRYRALMRANGVDVDKPVDDGPSDPVRLDELLRLWNSSPGAESS